MFKLTKVLAVYQISKYIKINNYQPQLTSKVADQTVKIIDKVFGDWPCYEVI